MTNIVPASANDPTAKDFPFFFVVEQIRGKYADWRPFKDLIRGLLPGEKHPGYVSMDAKFTPFAANRSYFATFRVKTSTDATAVYSGLLRVVQEDGSYLHVHLFDSVPQGSYYRWCNCYSYGYVSVQGHCCHYYPGVLIPGTPGCVSAAPAPAVPVSYAQPAIVTASPASTEIHAITTGFSNLEVAQLTYSYAQPAYIQNPTYVQNPGYTTAYPQNAWYSQQPQATAAPIYVKDPHGLSVNVSQGAIRTEHRNLHISNLDYKVRQSELERLLSKEAKPRRVDLAMDGSSRKNKGTALAYFSTSDEAKRVMERFDGYAVHGKKLRIKPDKNTTSVETATGPTIINGSTGYQH